MQAILNPCRDSMVSTKLAACNKRLVRAGVQPGKAAAEALHPQLAAAQIVAVDVGDLQLAPRRRLQLAAMSTTWLS